MKRVALYMRVSSDLQAKEGDSIPAQRDALTKYAINKGYAIAGEYLDDGISGTKYSQRDELQRMLSDVQAGKIDMIIFTKLDRFFRSVMAQLVSTGFLRPFRHFHIILSPPNRCQNISMFISENLNPLNKRTDDCVVRALAKVLGIDWKSAYTMLSAHGLKMADMFSKNYVWGDLLLSLGFTRSGIPNTCPDCYTVAEFARDHPAGTYIIGTGDHAVAVIGGNWFDSFDSGSMIPIICYRRE